MPGSQGRLAGKVALVTGGGSGFGAAISTLFASEGANVLIGDINTTSALTLATKDKYPTQIIVQTMNVSKRSDWDAAVALAVKEFGTIDILVNNAGTSYKNKPTLEVTEEDYVKCFDVNVLSVFHSVGAVFPIFIERKGGVVVNISSCGADRPRQGLVWYNASKGAVSNATKGLALEYGPQQIRVNSICPLLSGTGLFESFAGVPDTPENRQKFLCNVPLGRLTETIDVANAALFLASDEGSFITGVNLEVDGGRTI
ncbi:4-formylbenzenesulfonate dehydrogenase TsaC1/TsaC2 [Lachnellula suecica]|uniref:4-formylbenzenesulfonate dehydrogenase TsaC1/TsaC2 n=1 Tax=Lachnellula suecica TaxID=602035 RepID=A0A8T9CIG2_9HELO|nr:4-formylbenzenesulfonate dehydrogenase TsaC1/TsaC2 [Lachnellula suecica]